jgi:hypothetical protein
LEQVRAPTAAGSTAPAVPDRAVHIVQPEKLPVTQRGYDPAFDNLYADLDLGLPDLISTSRCAKLGRLIPSLILIWVRLQHKCSQGPGKDSWFKVCLELNSIAPWNRAVFSAGDDLANHSLTEGRLGVITHKESNFIYLGVCRSQKSEVIPSNPVNGSRAGDFGIGSARHSPPQIGLNEAHFSCALFACMNV